MAELTKEVEAKKDQVEAARGSFRLGHSPVGDELIDAHFSLSLSVRLERLESSDKAEIEKRQNSRTYRAS